MPHFRDAPSPLGLFGKLPGELRNAIWEDLVIEEDPIDFIAYVFLFDKMKFRKGKFKAVNASEEEENLAPLEEDYAPLEETAPVENVNKVYSALIRCSGAIHNEVSAVFTGANTFRIILSNAEPLAYITKDIAAVEAVGFAQHALPKIKNVSLLLQSFPILDGWDLWAFRIFDYEYVDYSRLLQLDIKYKNNKIGWTAEWDTTPSAALDRADACEGNAEAKDLVETLPGICLGVVGCQDGNGAEQVTLFLMKLLCLGCARRDDSSIPTRNAMRETQLLRSNSGGQRHQKEAACGEITSARQKGLTTVARRWRCDARKHDE